ncbi:MAG: DNA repair protein RecO [Candidatus Omnitrophica bacterium]|nr:DNA repair protein RecO [Candidatus Omnitrophota bacterium]
MAIVTTEAVLLRRREIRETSVLLTALSRDSGKVTGLLKGVRGARGTVDGFLEPFTIQTLVFYERTRSDIDLITHCDLREPFLALRRDLAKTAYASYFCELADHLVQPRDPHPEFYELLVRALTALQESLVPSPIARLFEVRVLAAGGVLPSATSLALSPGATLSLQQMAQAEPAAWGRLRLSRGVEEELTPLLQRLLVQHLEVRLKSLEFLHEVGVA